MKSRKWSGPPKEGPNEDAPTPPIVAVSGESPFRDCGTVTPSKQVPIINAVLDPQSVVGEELRLLRANLQGVCRPRQITCVAVTSALPGEGKSTISIGLAAALARGPGRRVLLIEADLRRPTIAKTLGLPPVAGLAEWLYGRVDRPPVRQVVGGGFQLLVAGQAAMQQPELLGSPKMDALLRSAREAYDFVLLDATPALPVADIVLLQNLIDGFLLVARSRTTPRAAILEALGRLDKMKALGVVFNDHKEYRHSYRSYAYKSYGMRAGQEDDP